MEEDIKQMPYEKIHGSEDSRRILTSAIIA